MGFHRPRYVAFDGADHTGLDVFMRCTRCGLRSVGGVECATVTDEVRAMLKQAWADGTTRKAIVR